MEPRSQSATDAPIGTALPETAAKKATAAANLAKKVSVGKASEPAPAANLLSAPLSQAEVLRSLRAKVGCVSTARNAAEPTFSTGCSAMDVWLPHNGLHPGTLTEWVAAHESAAAESLSLRAAACRLDAVTSRPLVIVDCEGTFYPPAAVALGVPAQRMILLRPRGSDDALWAIDQALRSGAVAAVLARLPMRLDDRDGRRLQLAAETGNTPGLFIRNFQARHLPSFAETQFYVAERKRLQTPERLSPRHRLSSGRDSEVISVTLDRVRGGQAGKQLDVRFDDSGVLHPVPSSDPQRHETAAKRLASQLANPAAAKRVAARRTSRTAS
ncbi:hypothetical protein CGZ80_07125 [Rhodopirellula sp. MGV]|nr:hypothetical protein CGZ80_07125 [Rhodopirellula sp. MGV]